jgi:hypothetical protein
MKKAMWDIDGNKYVAVNHSDDYTGYEKQIAIIKYIEEGKKFWIVGRYGIGKIYSSDELDSPLEVGVRFDAGKRRDVYIKYRGQMYTFHKTIESVSEYFNDMFSSYGGRTPTFQRLRELLEYGVTMPEKMVDESIKHHILLLGQNVRDKEIEAAKAQRELVEAKAKRNDFIREGKSAWQK